VRVIAAGWRGESLLEALRRREAARSGSAEWLSAPCGGRGRCGKCRVRVDSSDRGEGIGVLGPPSADERAFLGEDELAEGLRLACAARFARDGELGCESADEGLAVPLGALDQGTAASNGPGDEDGRGLKLAVDLGTTTVAACLLDASGRTLGQSARANPQRAWGADVMSRIEAARSPAALELMRLAAAGQVASLAEELLARSGSPLGALGEIVVAGNTVMLHLLVGRDPSGMGRVPFAPAFLEELVLEKGETGLRGLPGARLRLLPGISAFVGADLTAGIVATSLGRSRRNELLVDLGTNGEIVLSTPSGLLCAATAAGPAFEGASIACGSASVGGAIDHALWEGDGLWFSTIGGLPPEGICGSGLLDIAAALRLRGIVDETGFLEEGEGEAGDRRFCLGSGREVYVTQADLRQLQLAKGAIAAGVRLVCAEAGIGLAEVGRVHLAGGFGSYLDPRSALAIGLLPPEFAGKIVAEGNTSLRGAVLAAGSARASAACRAVATSARAVDLASLPAFQDVFMESMLFPEDSALEGLSLG
jgi:uncharacterized 2Fe-2S/4Fe-4S cluster protein (DUF4445 family)